MQKLLIPTILTLLLSSLINPSYADKGQLEIISTPGGAKIYVNGKRKGSTPVEAGRAFVIELNEGEHIVEALIPSTGQWEQYTKKEIFVAEDTLQPATLKLTKRISAIFRNSLKQKHPKPIEPKMVLIKGGSFKMGCVSQHKKCRDDEKPVHTVTVDSFLMGQYEVTFNEWDACVAANACSHYPEDDKTERGQRAVNKVSWEDAQQYMQWLNQQTAKQYRLPTEAEWEYAARAGTTTAYYWGNSDSNAGSYTWYTKNADDIGEKYAHTVGQKQPNSWGLYDMSGNVREWVSDWYDENYYRNSPANNPKGTGSGRPRVNRGGSWGTYAGYLRSADRLYDSPGYRYSYLGFRLVRKP